MKNIDNKTYSNYKAFFEKKDLEIKFDNFKFDFLSQFPEMEEFIDGLKDDIIGDSYLKILENQSNGTEDLNFDKILKDSFAFYLNTKGIILETYLKLQKKSDLLKGENENISDKFINSWKVKKELGFKNFGELKEDFENNFVDFNSYDEKFSHEKDLGENFENNFDNKHFFINTKYIKEDYFDRLNNLAIKISKCFEFLDEESYEILGYFDFKKNQDLNISKLDLMLKILEEKYTGEDQEELILKVNDLKNKIKNKYLYEKIKEKNSVDFLNLRNKRGKDFWDLVNKIESKNKPLKYLENWNHYKISKMPTGKIIKNILFKLKKGFDVKSTEYKILFRRKDLVAGNALIKSIEQTPGYLKDKFLEKFIRNRMKKKTLN